jgi:TPR repeat protein
MMRCVLAVLPVLLLVAALQPPAVADEAKDDAALVKACDTLVADPFAGGGPREWSSPFQTIDSFQAIPICNEALKRRPQDQGLALKTALAYVAGRKNEAAKPLLDRLVAENNASAMLALAFISRASAATDLMRKAAEAGNPSGKVLYGMAQLTGQGVPKNEIAGVRILREAAEAGSTRAMLILANFYYEGDFGIGYDPEEAKRLVTEAASRGDPSAKEALSHLELNAEAAHR